MILGWVPTRSYKFKIMPVTMEEINIFSTQQPFHPNPSNQTNYHYSILLSSGHGTQSWPIKCARKITDAWVKNYWQMKDIFFFLCTWSCPSEESKYHKTDTQRMMELRGSGELRSSVMSLNRGISHGAEFLIICFPNDPLPFNSIFGNVWRIKKNRTANSHF